jgi:threonine dehydrogenase-like Zn-dependent dehydrogenase
VTDVPEPRLESPRDAVVTVTAAAICGADLFPVHGMTPGFDDATVLGHEFTGTVAAVGPAVESVRAGQRVVCSSTVSDGTCGHCREGRPSQCEPQRVVSHHLALNEAAEAYRLFGQRIATKAVLYP